MQLLSISSLTTDNVSCRFVAAFHVIEMKEISFKLKSGNRMQHYYYEAEHQCLSCCADHILYLHNETQCVCGTLLIPIDLTFNDVYALVKANSCTKDSKRVLK